MMTNVNGLATGLIGSLGYWLEQQGVRRGNQPQYYYVGLLLPVYEFLPMLGSALAMTTGLGVFLASAPPATDAATATMGGDGSPAAARSASATIAIPAVAGLVGCAGALWLHHRRRKDALVDHPSDSAADPAVRLVLRASL